MLARRADRLVYRLARQSKPQSGRRAPLAACSQAHLLPVGKFRPHIMQQEIGIGPDQLEGERRMAASRRVTYFGLWQVAQPAA